MAIVALPAPSRGRAAHGRQHARGLPARSGAARRVRGRARTRRSKRSTRPDLEAFVRDVDGRRACRRRRPRASSRPCAASTGSCGSAGDVAQNPADDLHAPRALAALPRFLSLDDVDALLAAPDVTTPRGLRDRALIEVLYATGLRVSELVGLRLTDVRVERGLPAVPRQGQQGAHRAARRRGGRRGCAATSPTARPALLAQAATSPWLFVNARGGARLSRVGFWKILKAYGRRAGVRGAPEPARAAALVRDASARARRRSARDPGDARPRRSVDDADLHARARGAAAPGLRPVSSARVSRRHLTAAAFVWYR